MLYETAILFISYLDFLTKTLADIKLFFLTNSDKFQPEYLSHQRHFELSLYDLLCYNQDVAQITSRTQWTRLRQAISATTQHTHLVCQFAGEDEDYMSISVFVFVIAEHVHYSCLHYPRISYLLCSICRWNVGTPSHSLFLEVRQHTSWNCLYCSAVSINGAMWAVAIMHAHLYYDFTVNGNYTENEVGLQTFHFLEYP